MKVKEFADVLSYDGPIFLKSVKGGRIQSFKTNIVDLLVDRIHTESEIDFIVTMGDHVSIFLK